MRMVYMHPRHRHHMRRYMSEGVYLPVNVNAIDDEYVIRAYVPGVDAEDLEIAVEGNALTIGGEFALESAEDEQIRQSELPSGRFQRTLHFAAELDASQAEATVANGVLTLRVAKAESAKTKRIEVKAN